MHYTELNINFANDIEDMAKKNNNELEKKNQAFLIYQDENGIARVNVRFEGEDVWLLQEQMMELFDASRQDVSYHINQIYAEGEQDPNRTRKNFLIVRQEGNPQDNLTRMFFATVQNKLHYAAHQHTAAEVIYERVDAEKPMVGMTNFKGGYITKEDVQIAKNYLTEQELTYLNLLVSQYLDFAEVQALQQIPMKMVEWIKKLDDLMTLSGRQLLVGKGAISHEEAKKKAIAEFEKYRKMEMLQYESDYDRAIKELIHKENCPPTKDESDNEN